MDNGGVKNLLAAVIEQAVRDWRKSAASGSIDRTGIEIYSLKRERSKHGPSSSLNSFFWRGGLEVTLNAACLDLNPHAIRREIDKAFKQPGP